MNKDSLLLFIQKAKEQYNDNYDFSFIDLDNETKQTKIKIKCNICNLVFEINPYNFLRYKTPCPYCRKLIGREPRTNKFKPYENEKIVQLADNLEVIKVYDSIDYIFIYSGINKNKKNDIKRCCLTNHEKINNKQKFKFSKCCEIIWIYNLDLEKVKDKNVLNSVY